MDFNKKLFFDRVVGFVSDLSVVFGSKQHSLLLYNRLLEKTKPMHREEINKQVNIFSNFISQNYDAIIAKDFSLFSEKTIRYSDKIKINLEEIFVSSDSETKEQIWKHLLYIANCLNPTGEASNILKKSLSENTKESEFLNNLCKKIESNVKEDTDPMTAVMGLMQNGVITDLIGSMQEGMKDGSLDMNKLFSTVQTMMGSMGENGASMPDLSQLANLLPPSQPDNNQ